MEATQQELTCNHLVGKSDSLKQASKLIPIAAGCDVTVLLSGETGTGKEVFARSIHYRSNRSAQPFIPVNCGALPDHLFENELFGHARGAYTDAGSATKGLIAEAESGTLFLDEVDALSLGGQVKLLRFLQDRQYRPLGSSSLLCADVRIIAATNCNLQQKVDSQCFRQDLFYRLKSFPIVIPPLRDRMGDIPCLCLHFLNVFSEQYHLTPKTLSNLAMDKLMNYDWPGNVRELESIIHQAVLVSRSLEIGPDELNISVELDEEIDGSSLANTFNNAEREYVMDILSKCNGNVTHAARAAGKARRSFQRLLQKHRIDRQSFLASQN